jgi:hypothetical protein
LFYKNSALKYIGNFKLTFLQTDKNHQFGVRMDYITIENGFTETSRESQRLFKNWNYQYYKNFDFCFIKRVVST